MKDHRVKVQYVFEGCYKITAEDEQRAREIAWHDYGLVIGGNIHTSNPSQVVDRTFDSHPEKRILTSQQINYSAGRAEVRL